LFIANKTKGDFLQLTKPKLWCTAVLGSMFLAGAARADVLTVSTITGTGPGVSATWNGLTATGAWDNDVPSFGQAFVDPSGYQDLDSMTFEIENDNGAAFSYQAYVYAWNGTAVTGSALFASPVETMPVTSGFQPITVATPNLTLTPGQEYMAFFSVIGEGGSPGPTFWGAIVPNGYSNGGFAYSAAKNFGQLTSTWSSGGTDDMAFTLVFDNGAQSPVPEPSAAWLFLPVAAVAGLLVRRRKGASAA
jgi:hypothetical protein